MDGYLLPNKSPTNGGGEKEGKTKQNKTTFITGWVYFLRRQGWGLLWKNNCSQRSITSSWKNMAAFRKVFSSI